MAGARGAVVGGLAFVVPAITMVLLLSLLFLAHGPPAARASISCGAGREWLRAVLAEVPPTYP